MDQIRIKPDDLTNAFLAGVAPLCAALERTVQLLDAATKRIELLELEVMHRRAEPTPDDDEG